MRAAEQIGTHTSTSGHAGLFVDGEDQELELDEGRLDDTDEESASHSDSLGIFHASFRQQPASARRVRFVAEHKQAADGSTYDAAVHGARAPPRV